MLTRLSGRGSFKGLAFLDVFQRLREARADSEAEGPLLFHAQRFVLCLLPRGDLLGGSEDLPPLRAGPPELGDPAVDRLGHSAHGVGVLLALPLQLTILEPFVERLGVKHLGSNQFLIVL